VGTDGSLSLIPARANAPKPKVHRRASTTRGTHGCPLELRLGDAVIVARIWVIGLLAVVLLLGCQEGGQAPDSAIVQIRNLTASAVAVQITEPYSGTETHGAPPWHPGDCSLSFGTAPGHVVVGVRGPSIEGNPTHTVEVVANGPQVWITVTIEATGMVTFGSTELADGSCQAENEVPVPSGY
jgi:hypothetical protein